ncbi:hypothetical protein JAAARDRAFT_701189 [Jaapia argillacea MUCL 33604]|uniref:Yeast cell wall synthesis Kre9/Knh1-like N-terminal domain-containing protein n=1 Tax=Jaapia argillacea MUCL 33604 TaxID=933084 RepID=A0A067Q645_9AGAM|nr:hypothetical protein JAAARDRAFT_701189 [Jaapia argillacea MUCL 33604]
MFPRLPALVASILLLASAAHSSPTPAAATELIVYSPPITSPTAGQIWPKGSIQTVTWDTSNIPSEKENSTGLLLLGYEQNGSENLNIAQPLASGFLLSTGSVQVTVPNVVTRFDYIVVLFGDSGNTSPEFTIL